MIQKSDVIAFFDARAGAWDSEMIRSDEKIRIILDNAHVRKGSRVLDVACGTGVLLPDYLAREVESVTAIDISSEMIRIAREKFPQENVTFICGDVETEDVGRDFDAIVVYNAFPHFPDGERLIRRLAGLLAPGGILTVAHGMSREAIDGHHQGSASKVSNGLMSVTRLAGIFDKVLNVTAILSDERMYQVAAAKAEKHSHEHTHADGTEHTHTHSDGHTHSHGDIPVEALLAHMAEHNRSHAAELEELADHMEGAARDAVLDALFSMQDSTDRLAEALNLFRCGL